MWALLSLFYLASSSPYIIAINNESPFSICDSFFYGYEVDIVREALTLNGWIYGTDYQFECADTALNQNATLGRVQMSATKLRDGYQYTLPTYNGQLGILVYQDREMTTEKIVGVFSLNLWLSFIVTAFVTGFIIWFIERTPGIPIISAFKQFFNGQWIAWSSLFFSGTWELNHRPSRMLIWTFWAISYGFMALFLAACAYQSIQTFKPISYPEKLDGKRYLTTEKSLDFTSHYSGYHVTKDITVDNYSKYLKYLRNGEVDAIIMEREIIKKIASEECDLVVSGGPFVSILYSVEIEPNTDNTLKQALDNGLTLLIENINLNTIRETYMSVSNACSEVSDIDNVKLYSFGELWITLGVTVFFVFLLRSFLKKSELVRERKRHIQEVKRLMSRPETKILRVTEKQVRFSEGEIAKLLHELEKSLKRQNSLQQGITNLVRHKELQIK